MKYILDKRWLARLSFSQKNSDGFTLVELLVTLGIFMIFTGVVLSNYRGYNKNALFANASEDIVLALRQAQVYGVGAKGEGSSFTTPYGVYFDTNAVLQSQIKIFADGATSLVGAYDAGDILVETIAWTPNIKITSITCNGLTALAVGVTFKRPNPNAILTHGDGTACTNPAKITITDSNTTRTSSITITSAGQISLK